MAVPDFFLSIDCPGASSSDMLREVVSRVLAQAGCRGNDGGSDEVGITAALQAAMAECEARGERDCRVTFRVHGGKLDIAMTSAAGEHWQTSRSVD